MSISTESVKFKVYNEGFSHLNQLAKDGIKFAVSHFMPIYDSTFNAPISGGVKDVTNANFLVETGSHATWWAQHETTSGGLVTGFIGEKLSLAGSYSLDGKIYTRANQYELINVGGIDTNDATRLPTDASVTISQLVANANTRLWRVGDFFPISSQATSGSSSAGQWEILVPRDAGSFRFNKVAVFASQFDALGNVTSSFFIGMLFSNIGLKKRYLANEYNIPLAIRLSVILTDVPPNASYDEYIFIGESRFWRAYRDGVTTDYSVFLGEDLEQYASAESRYTKLRTPLVGSKSPLFVTSTKDSDVATAILYHSVRKGLDTLIMGVTNNESKRFVGSLALPTIQTDINTMDEYSVEVYDSITSYFNPDDSTNSLSNVGVNFIKRQGNFDTHQFSGLSRIDWNMIDLFNPNATDIGFEPIEHIALRMGIYDLQAYSQYHGLGINDSNSGGGVITGRKPREVVSPLSPSFGNDLVGGFFDVHGRFNKIRGGGRPNADRADKNDAYIYGAYNETIGIGNGIGLNGYTKSYSFLQYILAQGIVGVTSDNDVLRFGRGFIAPHFSTARGYDNNIFSDYTDVLGECNSVSLSYSRVTGFMIDISNTASFSTNSKNSVIGSYLFHSSVTFGNYTLTQSNNRSSLIEKYMKDTFGENPLFPIYNWSASIDSRKNSMGSPPIGMFEHNEVRGSKIAFGGSTTISALSVSGYQLNLSDKYANGGNYYSDIIGVGSKVKSQYSRNIVMNSSIYDYWSDVSANDSIVSAYESDVIAKIRANVNAISSSVNMVRTRELGCPLFLPLETSGTAKYREWGQYTMQHTRAIMERQMGMDDGFYADGKNNPDFNKTYLTTSPFFPRLNGQIPNGVARSAMAMFPSMDLMTTRQLEASNGSLSQEVGELMRRVTIVSYNFDILEEIYFNNKMSPDGVGVKTKYNEGFVQGLKIIHKPSATYSNLFYFECTPEVRALRDTLLADSTKKALITYPVVSMSDSYEIQIDQLDITDIIKSITDLQTEFTTPYNYGISVFEMQFHFDWNWIGVVVNDGADSVCDTDVTKQWMSLNPPSLHQVEMLNIDRSQGGYIRYVAFMDYASDLPLDNPASPLVVKSSDVRIQDGVFRGLFDGCDIRSINMYGKSNAYQGQASDYQNVVSGIYTIFDIIGSGNIVNNNSVGSIVRGVENFLGLADEVPRVMPITYSIANSTSGINNVADSYYGDNATTTNHRIDGYSLAYGTMANGLVGSTYDTIIGSQNRIEHDARHLSGFNDIYGIGHQMALRFDNSGTSSAIDGVSTGSWWYNQIFGYRNAIIGYGQSSGIWYGGSSSGKLVDFMFTGGEFNLVWGKNLIATRREQIVFGVNNEGQINNIFELGVGFDYRPNSTSTSVHRQNAFSVGYEGRLVDKSDYGDFKRFLDPEEYKLFMQQNPHKNLMAEFLAVKCDARMLIIGSQGHDDQTISRWFKVHGKDASDSEIAVGDLVYAWTDVAVDTNVRNRITIGSWNKYIERMITTQVTTSPNDNDYDVYNNNPYIDGETNDTTSGYYTHSMPSDITSVGDAMQLMGSTKLVNIIGIAQTNSSQANYNSLTKIQRENLPYNYGKGVDKWCLVAIQGGTMVTSIGKNVGNFPMGQDALIGSRMIKQFENLVNGGLDCFGTRSKNLVAFRSWSVDRSASPYFAKYSVYIP